MRKNCVKRAPNKVPQQQNQNPIQKIPQNSISSDVDEGSFNWDKFVQLYWVGGGGSHRLSAHLVHIQVSREQAHFEQGLDQAWTGGSWCCACQLFLQIISHLLVHVFYCWDCIVKS